MTVNILDRPSPNFNDRPNATPSLIVVHGTAGKSDAGDLSWCRAKESQVSYHYLIGRDGTVYQLVDDVKRAWHAGKSVWEGRADCNDYSIGIGLSNDGLEPYSRGQYESCRALLALLRERWNVPAARVVGHYHVSPGRKTDPWYHFEWGRVLA